MKLDHTLAEMGQIGKELRRRFRQSLSQQKKNTSGGLSKSIRYDNKLKGGEVSLSFEMLDYADYVNKGVRGANRSPFSGQGKSPYKYSGKFKTINQKSIDRWVVRKGLAGTRDEQGRFVSRRSMVFLISRAIYQRGLKPTFFIDKPMSKMEKEISRRLADAYERDIQVYFDSFAG